MVLIACGLGSQGFVIVLPDFLRFCFCSGFVAFLWQLWAPQFQFIYCILKGLRHYISSRLLFGIMHRQLPAGMEFLCTYFAHPYSQVQLRHGVYISRSTWGSLMAIQGDSAFCKRLALAIWGPEVLAERSLTGTASNKAVSKGNKAVFQAVSPLKLAGMSCRCTQFFCC